MSMNEGFDPSTYLPQSANTVTHTPQTDMMVSRQAQEVQMAMYVAKRFPRDTYEAFNRIMKACERPMLAEAAMYEFPRGGAKVTGPSIRLAETLAREWGNLDFGVLELEQKPGESTAMAYAWDLETNTRQTKVFVVKHEMKAKGSIKRLDDPRDIYEMVANQGARRVRSCILGIIPGDIVDAAVEKCKHTLTHGHKEPLEDRVRKMITVFDSEFQVTQVMLEQYIGCNAAAFSEQDLLRLKNVGRALRDGMAKRDDYFDIRQGQKETFASDTEKAFKEARKGRQETATTTEPTDDLDKAEDALNAELDAEKGGARGGRKGTGSEQSADAKQSELL